MAVKSSGTLSFNTDIVGEFGGTTPHSLSEYKRGGSLVPDAGANSDIPTTNSNIQFSDFYGASNIIDASEVITPVTINGQTTAKELTVSDYISSGGTLEIPSSWWIWSDNVSKAALVIDIPCTIINNGKIIGKGGQGGSAHSGSGYQNGPAVAAQDGGPAISINNGVTGVTIQNNSGAYIAGGGGGGGGNGGGGGAGGGNAGRIDYSNNQVGIAWGGAINAAGTSSVNGLKQLNGSTSTASNGSGSSGQNYRSHNRSGGAGGAGAEYWVGNNDTENTTGGAGGRILPGSGGQVLHYQNYGDGGSAGNAGTSGRSSSQGNHPGSAGGGGGWGAAGGGTNGGAGGKAVEDNSTNYTLTNNGTIYGATT